jgi:hypothetical protein
MSVVAGELAFYVTVTRPGDSFQLMVECSGAVTAGRDPSNAVVLPHPLVSRRHLRIARVRLGFEVEDLDCRNGTLLDGEPLAGARVVGGPAVAEAGPFILAISSSVSEQTWTAAQPARTPRTLLDRGPRQFHIDGALVLDVLTSHEYVVLDILESQAPAVVERDVLGDAVWGAGQWDAYMLHNLISRIRRRITQGGAAGEVIVTVPGVGYRLE